MSRKRIMKAATEAGLQVVSLLWEPVIYLEMGDCLGGWEIQTDNGSYGAITAEGIIEWIKSR